MFTLTCRCVAYKTYDSKSKVEVTLRSQNSVNLYLDLVEKFMLMSRHVKTYDSISKVYVTVRGHESKFGKNFTICWRILYLIGRKVHSDD